MYGFLYVLCILYHEVHLFGNLLIKSDLDALKHCASNTAGVDVNNSVSVDNNTAESEVPTDHDNTAMSGRNVTADSDVETEPGTRELEVNASRGRSESSRDHPGFDQTFGVSLFATDTDLQRRFSSTTSKRASLILYN
jgi:hypothetical protein